MYQSIVKPVLIGLIVGAACFFMPFFILNVVAFFILAGIFIRLFIFRRLRRVLWANPRFADKIRNMSDAEYARYKKRNYRPYYDYYNRPTGPTVEVEIK